MDFSNHQECEIGRKELKRKMPKFRFSIQGAG
jgi:hypothetical protein